MSGIKIALDSAELAAVRRLAEELKLTPEDVAYCALNRLMLQADGLEAREDIIQTKAWRKENLPLWSDSAGSVHAYESMPDEEPAPKHKHHPHGSPES